MTDVFGLPLRRGLAVAAPADPRADGAGLGAGPGPRAWRTLVPFAALAALASTSCGTGAARTPPVAPAGGASPYCEVVEATREPLVRAIGLVTGSRNEDVRHEAREISVSVVRRRAAAAPPELRVDYDAATSALDRGGEPPDAALARIGAATVARCGGVDDLQAHR